MPQPNLVNTFLQEAEDLLAQIEEVALSVNLLAPDPEVVNRLFRAFHTIKGSGAMFGFEAVAAFTHHVENVLDKARDGALTLSQELLDLVLASKDQIKALLDASQGIPGVLPGSGDNLILALNRLAGGLKAEVQSAENENHLIGTQSMHANGTIAECSTQSFRIIFQPNQGIMAEGTNPLSLLNELRTMGECKVAAHTDAVPLLHSIKPDQCYLWWEISLTTRHGENAIRDVFIFVEEDSKITIELLVPPVQSSRPSECYAATNQAIKASAQALIADQSRLQSEASIPSALAQGREREAGAVRKPAIKDSTVRVPSQKLDRLVNLVGELVMNQSRLTQVASRLEHADLAAPVEEIERLVSELRDNVLGIRMMPIGTTFSRYKRLVHDLSAELAKEIDLVTEGDETELDKTVLDQLGDPLVHLIRNSLDHGIETPEDRSQLGKPRRGTIRLSAAHAGSNVLVSVQDDGKGLDLEAIRAKAIDKKILGPEVRLSDKETFNLIFLPGFSTAKQITSVSGRGVGMDVVKRQIDSLRGSIAISSEIGRGTKISLTLPLTLAIIDGLLVEIGRDQYIVPMSVVTENVELHRHERSRNNGRNVIVVRGELVPYFRLREGFVTETCNEPDVEKIVIVRHQDQRVGLVVDRVLGSHQTVIQSLGKFYRDIDIVSGATIMGDGRVALILSLTGLIAFANQQGANKGSQSL